MVKLLVGSLPKPGDVWPRAERQKWMNLAEAASDVVYKEETTTSRVAPSEPAPPSEQSPGDAPD